MQLLLLSIFAPRTVAVLFVALLLSGWLYLQYGMYQARLRIEAQEQQEQQQKQKHQESPAKRQRTATK